MMGVHFAEGNVIWNPIEKNQNISSIAAIALYFWVRD